jgi:hypothetical protein
MAEGIEEVFIVVRETGKHCKHVQKENFEERL